MTKTNLWNHPKVGERVRYIGAPEGEERFGAGVPTRWVRGGAEGVVTRIIEGYAEHNCPNHDGGIDCICMDESGRVPPQMQAPVVAYETREGDPVEQCISPENEGTLWERV